MWFGGINPEYYIIFCYNIIQYNMEFCRFIDIKVFLLSLAFGLFAVYISMPDLRLIYVYPTPENIEALQYRDRTNTCYSIKQREVECPNDPTDIAEIPIQP